MKKAKLSLLLSLLTTLVLLLTGCSGGGLSEKDVRTAKDIDHFSAEGIARIKLESGKYGYINCQGKTVAMPQWDRASDFQNGVAVVGNDGKPATYGAIDATGKVIVPLEPRTLSWYPDAQVFLSLKKTDSGTEYTVLDVTGKVIAKNWDKISDFWTGHATVLKGDLYGLIDAKGSVVFQPRYRKLINSQHQLWALMDDGDWCRIDLTGKVLDNVSETLRNINTLGKNSGITVKVPGYEPYIASLSDELTYLTLSVEGMGTTSPLRVQGLYNGKTVFIPLLSEGYAVQWYNACNEDYILATVCPLKQSKKYKSVIEVDTDTYLTALIDKDGNVIVKPGQYDSMDHYEYSEVIHLRKNKKSGLMAPDGTVLVRPGYDAINENRGGYHAFKQGNRWGFLDANGSLIIPDLYESVGGFGNGCSAVKFNGEWTIIDPYGKSIF